MAQIGPPSEIRPLLRLGVPIVITQLGQMMLGVVEMLYAGRIGVDAFDAVSLGLVWQHGTLWPLVGVVIAGFVCLFARPRLRVGPAGVAVRNLFAYRLFPWSDAVDVSFHKGARWARLDLPDDEYVPVMAIQAVDKGRAVEAMDQVRAAFDRYQPDITSHRP